MVLHPGMVGWAHRLQLLKEFLAYVRGVSWGLESDQRGVRALLENDVSSQRISETGAEYLARLSGQS